jgi:hypothetical protein
VTRCIFLNCREPGVWSDEDSPNDVYCGAHQIYVAYNAVVERRREVREEIANELRGERFDADARRSW